MPHFLLRRLVLLLPRLLAVWLLAVLVVELALLGPGGAGEKGGIRSHDLLQVLTTGEAPVALAGPAAESLLWREVIGNSAIASAKVAGLALLTTLSFAPLLGVAAARLRRHPWFEILLSPFFAAAWIPGVWIACLAIWVRFQYWNQPGFADAPPATGGPVAWEPLWRTVLVAIPVSLTSVGWQMRFLAGRLKRAAKEPHVQAAWVRGQGGAALFYRHVFYHSIDPVVRSLDRSLPAMLGVQLLVEWTYRYPGLGKLAIDCAKAPEFAGLLATGIIMGSFLVVAQWTGETVAALLAPDS